jgi:hypothetical protein
MGLDARYELGDGAIAVLLTHYVRTARRIIRAVRSA